MPKSNCGREQNRFSHSVEWNLPCGGIRIFPSDRGDDDDLLRNLISSCSWISMKSGPGQDMFSANLPTVSRFSTYFLRFYNLEDQHNFIAWEHFLHKKKRKLLLLATEIKEKYLLCSPRLPLVSQFMHTRIFHLRKKTERTEKTFSIMNYLFMHDAFYSAPRRMTLWEILWLLDSVLRQGHRFIVIRTKS